MGKTKNKLLNSLFTGDFGKHVLDALFARYGSTYSICFYRPDQTEEYLRKRLLVISNELLYLEGQLDEKTTSPPRANDNRSYLDKLKDASGLTKRKYILIEKLREIERSKRNQKPSN